VLYRNALKARGIEIPLYLAIPTSAYGRIFSKTVVTAMVRELQIKLIVT
jgi:hypothetical protein